MFFHENLFCFHIIVCKKAANVIVVLDASGSMKNEWQKQVSFVGNLTRDFEFGPNKSHMGIIYFGSISVVHLDMNTKGMNKNEIDKKLRDLRNVEKSISPDNYTSTDLALKDAVKMFQGVSEERQEIPRILVVVTDGESSDKSSVLVDPILKLQDLKVIRLTIGVGLQQLGESRRRKALKELDAMASTVANKKLTYELKTFDLLLEDVNKFIQTVCTAPGMS